MILILTIYYLNGDNDGDGDDDGDDGNDDTEHDGDYDITINLIPAPAQILSNSLPHTLLHLKRNF